MRCGLLPPTRYDFYPRPPRGGRPCSCRRRVPPAGISIHALREEGDITVLIPNTYSKTFLSTPSARRATLRSAASAWYHEDFYPRPLRGGRPGRRCRSDLIPKISIHALCEEGDSLSCTPSGHPLTFLSTPSARRATSCPVYLLAPLAISIHALCEEGDAED